MKTNHAQIEALQQLKTIYPQVKVIVLSMHVEENYVSRALRLGASGFVYKGSAFDDLELAMHAVLKEEVFLSTAVFEVLVNGFLQTSSQQQQDQVLLERLSPREREILQLFKDTGHKKTNQAEGSRFSWLSQVSKVVYLQCACLKQVPALAD